MLEWNLLFYRQTHQSKTYFVVNVSINQSLSLEALKYLVSSQLWFSLLRTATKRKKVPSRDDRMILRWALGALKLNKFFNIFIFFLAITFHMLIYHVPPTAQDILFAFEHKERLHILSMATTWCDWALCVRLVWLLVGKFNSEGNLKLENSCFSNGCWRIFFWNLKLHNKSANN